MPSRLTEYNPELETLEAERIAWPSEGGSEILTETEELESAAELLAVSNEQELEQFLGKLIRKVGRSVGGIMRPPVVRAVGAILKGVVKNAIPPAGAAGNFVSGPLGNTIGSGLASMAGQALGVELEGLSHEDQEFEAARRFVHFASEAVNKAAAASPAQDPAVAARAAVAAAARHLAPGLLNTAKPIPSSSAVSDSGRWMRQGRNIIVINC